MTQLIDRKRRIISYFSKAVPRHQQKFGATKLKFLGLYSALKHWKLYLQSTEFTVLTDCLPLLRLQTIFNKENSFIQRHLADMAGYSFTIKHISGKSEQIQIADFLSRYPFEQSSKNAQTQTETLDEAGVQGIFLL